MKVKWVEGGEKKQQIYSNQTKHYKHLIVRLKGVSCGCCHTTHPNLFFKRS